MKSVKLNLVITAITLVIRIVYALGAKNTRKLDALTEPEDAAEMEKSNAMDYCIASVISFLLYLREWLKTVRKDLKKHGGSLTIDEGSLGSCLEYITDKEAALKRRGPEEQRFMAEFHSIREDVEVNKELDLIAFV